MQTTQITDISATENSQGIVVGSKDGRAINNSPLTATPAVAAKRKRGRPHGSVGEAKRKASTTVPINRKELPSTTLRLPPPPSQYIKKPDEFFEYWAGITDPSHRNRISVYVYRGWPVMDFRIFDTPGGRKSATNIDVIAGACPFDPKEWKTGILRRYGSGDYKMMFNEDSTNRCQCVNIDVRDMENYPPVIDYKYLVLTDKLNESYVRTARARGWLKNENDTQREDDEMADARSTEIMADTIKDLSQQIMVQRSTPAPAVPQASPASVTETKMNNAVIESMSKASEAVTEIMRKGYETASAASTKTSDPLEHVDRLLQIAKTLKGDNGDSAMVTMLTKMLDDSRADLRRLSDKLDALTTVHSTPPATTTEKPKTIIEQIREAKELMELFSGGGGKSDTDDDAGSGKKSSGMVGVAMELIGHLPKIMEQGVAITHNIAQTSRNARANQPQPYTPNPNINTVPAQQPVPTQSQPLEPELPLMGPGDVGTPQSGEVAQLAQFHTFLSQIEPALLKHLHDQTLTGADFAMWLVNSRDDGQFLYQQVHEAGAEMLVTVIKTYPPIWNVAVIIPKRFARFIDDFIAWGDESEEADDTIDPADSAA